MLKLTCIANGISKDITSFTSNYQKSDNLDALASEFSFSLVNNPLDRYYSNNALELGAKVMFENNGAIVFIGVLTDMNRSGLTQYQYKAFDFAYYLNKSQVMIQFNDASATDSIKRLCSENDIPVGEICQMATKITAVYDGRTVSDIIKDILKQVTNETAEKFKLEVEGGKLYIRKHSQMIIHATYKPAPNIAPFDVSLVPADYSSSYSIGEMVNKVLVISSKEKSMHIEAQEEDSQNIAKFGTLQRIEKVQDKDIAKAKQIAQNKIKDLNKVHRTLSLKLFGDDKVRSGRSLVFNHPNLDLVGTFLVKHCTHTYDNNNHFMSVELEVE